MDTITQALLGAVTAQLGFRPKIGRDAPWVAALSASIADADILIGPIKQLLGQEAEPFEAIVAHRGISHSLLAAPVIALAIALVWRFIRSRAPQEQQRPKSAEEAAQTKRTRPTELPSWWAFFGCAFVGALSHVFLDWCTSYGTQLLAPLSDRRFALDAIAIIDFIYTLILILTLLALWPIDPLSAKQSTRIKRLLVAWLGLALSMGYIAAGYALNQACIRQAQLPHHDSIWGGPRPGGEATYRAYPQIGSILIWRVTRKTDDYWQVGRVSFLARSNTPALDPHREPIMNNGWVRRAQDIPEVQTFTWFARGQVRARYQREDRRHVVYFDDMRYAWPPEGWNCLWSVRIVFDHTGKVQETNMIQHEIEGGVKAMLKQSWRRLIQELSSHDQTPDDHAE